MSSGIFLDMIKKAGAPETGAGKSILLGIGKTGSDVIKRVMEELGPFEKQPGFFSGYILVCEGAHTIPAGADNFYFADASLPSGFSPEYVDSLRQKKKIWGWLPEWEQLVAGKGESLTRPLARLGFFNIESFLYKSLISCMNIIQKGSGPETSEEQASDTQNVLPVFIVASPFDNLGSSVFLDAAAMVRDVFSDAPYPLQLYGILVMPGSSALSLPAESASGAYAMLKEINYFMNGGRFRVSYPSGRDVDIERIFDKRMLFLLDGYDSSLSADRNYDNAVDAAVSFIITVGEPAAGELVKRYVISGSPHGVEGGDEANPAREAGCFSSFGVASASYPVFLLDEAGYCLTASAVLGEFMKPVDSGLLLKFLGDRSGGLTRMLNLDCRMIFENLWPEHNAEFDTRMKGLRSILSAASSGDGEKFMTAARDLSKLYSGESIRYMGQGFVTRMEIRSGIELSRNRVLLDSEIRRVICDTSMGFNFALSVVDAVYMRLGRYLDKYNAALEDMQFYSGDDMEEIFAGDGTTDEKAEAVMEMVSFNYRHMLYRCMLVSARGFTKQFLRMLRAIMDEELYPVIRYMTMLGDELGSSAELCRYRLRGDSRNFYITSRDELDIYVEKIFGGLDIHEITAELNISELYDEIREHAVTQVFSLSASPVIAVLYRLISARVTRESWEHVTLNDILYSENLQDNELYNRLAAASEPLTTSLSRGRRGGETLYFYGPFNSTVKPGEQLPPANIVSCALCQPTELRAVTFFSGFPLYSLNSLALLSGNYHAVMSAGIYPLHVFGRNGLDARFFPDPAGETEYMDYFRLWSGLLLLSVLVEKGGVYVFEEVLIPALKEMVARENYKKIVNGIDRRFAEEGGIEAGGFRFVAEAVNMLGIMARESGGEGIVFRREYSAAINDMLRYSGPDASDSPGTVVFRDADDLADFLKLNPPVMSFILESMKYIIDRTKGNEISGACILLPASRVRQAEVPDFHDVAGFASYCTENGSREFFMLLKNRLDEKLCSYISGKFRDENNAGYDIRAITEFLNAIENRMPECVLAGTRMKYGA